MACGCRGMLERLQNEVALDVCDRCATSGRHLSAEVACATRRVFTCRAGRVRVNGSLRLVAEPSAPR